MMKLRVIATSSFVWLATGVLAAQSAPPKPTPTLEEKLGDVRYELHVEGRKFSGNGAPVLASAIADARYVLIGEDHLTREIPQFANGICGLMGDAGPFTMVVEASPEVAAFVAASLGKPDGERHMAELQRQYPDSVAFLNMRQEYELVQDCAASTQRRGFQLWGLDQPFLGSAGWLLDQILATHPGPNATKVITALKKKEESDAVLAQQTGDPLKLLLVSADGAELEKARGVLQREGSSTARALLEGLIESRDIYLKNLSGHAPESNEQRARMLKRRLSEKLQAVGGVQKLLIKFGDSHVYKGVNEIEQRDLGNYVAEIADAAGATSLHVCVRGAKGVHAGYGGHNRPLKHEPFTQIEDDPWMNPVVENQVASGWTLYDLRKLRFHKIENVSADMRRMIDGYDLLVIIPELTPGDKIE